MYAVTRRNNPKQQALLRRKSDRTFETDSAPILVRLLRAQGWTYLSWSIGRNKMTHMLAEHMDYGEIHVYESGLVIASGDKVLGFLGSLVEWCGGEQVSIPVSEPTIPIALCRLERRGEQFLWRVQVCPLCGATGKKAHRHGAGLPGEDPRRYLSHRSAHCLPMRPGGYILQEASS